MRSRWCSRTSALSYAELDARANQLAHHLRGRGVGPETVVGLCVERSLEMLVGLLGILKAGGAYLPLDPGLSAASGWPSCWRMPARRCWSRTRRWSTGSPPPARRDRARSMPTGPRSRASLPPRRPSTLDPQHPAYVIYTSGSTGTPKGVAVTHQNVVRLFGATEHLVPFGADDVWTLFHSFAFDFSVWEIWGALLYGGRLVVVPYAIGGSPSNFLPGCARGRDRPQPDSLGLLSTDAGGPGASDLSQTLALRYVVFGGKRWSREARSVVPAPLATRSLLVNMYGITETTVHVSYISLDRAAVTANAGSLVGRGMSDLRVVRFGRRAGAWPAGVVGALLTFRWL